ncbi:F-box domain-containing protein [Mycena kentingensis (nom. inval.)]|nr:F-box domain-containing protein [Mycena kentingensis (nom. inval.)]
MSAQALTDAQARAIRADIETREARLADMDAEASATLESSLVGLPPEYFELKKSIRAQRATLAARSRTRLPFEVLSTIFLVADQLHEDENFVSPDRTRCILARVCAHWRSVVSDTHGLWNEIWLQTAGSAHPWAKYLVQNHVKWSGRLGLTIRFSSLFSRVSGCFEALLGAASRWKDVRISLRPADLDLLRATAASSSLVFPLLQSLHFPQLAEDFAAYRSGDLAIDLDPLRCPKLHELLVPTVPDLDELPVPWWRLTAVVLRGSVAQVFPALELIPSLEKATIVVLDSLDSLGDDTRVVTTNSLRVLDLKQSPADPANHILGYLRAPALSSLSLTSYHEYAATLCTFLQTSSNLGHPLTRLALYSEPTLDELRDILELIPNLEHLTLEALGNSHRALFTNSFFKTVTCTPERAALVPCLISLTLRGLFARDLSTDVVLAMLRSRMESATIQRVEFTPNSASELFRHIMVLEAEGLNVCCNLPSVGLGLGPGFSFP